jgi:hypothetical protein
MKPVNRILSAQNASLQSLLERASAIDEINRSLLQFLPSPLNEHICLANIRDDTAVLLADSGAWLSRVRYLDPEILKFLKQKPGLARIKKLQFKIQPPSPLPENHPSRPSLSESAAELLISTAKGIDDPKLKAALHNLSRRHQKPSSGA